MSKKRGLGKGLSALLENANTDITQSGKSNQVAGSVAMVSIEHIETNPFQPRTDFEKDALLELSESIKEHGIIQPLTVRKMGNDQFQLISGERRFRASQIAGLKEVPAYIRIANDQAMLEMAIVENIQRENLNAIEIALSYKRLLEECNLTQKELGEKMAKSRSNITNYLRLLKLPAGIQLGIREQLISMGHARALLSIEDNRYKSQVYKKIINDNLSVRQVEEIAKNFLGNHEKNISKKTNKDQLENKYTDFVTNFSNSISSKVEIKTNKNGKGKISISFSDENELNRLIEFLQK